MTAVKLYIKYFHKAAAVIRELGYPNRHVLVQWFKEYEATGDLHHSSKEAGDGAGGRVPLYDHHGQQHQPGWLPFGLRRGGGGV